MDKDTGMVFNNEELSKSTFVYPGSRGLNKPLVESGNGPFPN
jgi:hypothetical protein